MMNSTLKPGNGGWCLLEEGKTPYQADHVMVYVRLVPSKGGRLEIRELYFAPQFGDGASTIAARLRAFSVARVEALANEAVMSLAIRSSLNNPAPLISTAASYFNQDISSEQVDASLAVGHAVNWVFQMVASQGEGSKLPPATEIIPSYWVLPPPPPPNLSLEVPPEGTRPYPREFFEAVAATYSQAAAVYHDPAPRIADENGVMVTTVHRWTKRCRQLGLLPPARAGRRG